MLNMFRYKYFPTQVENIRADKTRLSKPSHVVKIRKIDSVNRLPRAFRVAGKGLPIDSKKSGSQSPSKVVTQQLKINIRADKRKRRYK
jgi:hypothetical protein